MLEDNKQETLYLEDKFFITKSIINRNTEININKIFFPDKFKKKSIQFSSNNEDYYGETEEHKKKHKLYSYANKNDKKLQKSKLIPLNNKTINEKKDFPVVKNNLTISLNNELSRISAIYGREESLKKFTNNPITNQFYEDRNYLGYEIAKMNELQETNFRPKLKPLVLLREPTLKKLSESIFHIKELQTDHIDLNEGI